ncbi:hypothetical protein EJ02DRAFT_439317 [Clathrospora elynae]|uniref:Orc1-like AAA ATPase domain-containing protein n=1 Tax=Clathrospora elynae TaxID=706981 RepID=A0A6A5SD30_9PLEO|nr:hypothetical protein EJ02DRAFT_439317 [Clathrospora elynae]
MDQAMRNRDFVGQAALLQQLSEKLEQDAKSCVLVAGPSSIGKSYLIREFALSLQEASPETSFFWVDASSADTLSTGFILRFMEASEELH